MIKDILDHNETISANEREITILKEHFPACFKADGSFDIERFKEYIGDRLDVKGEGYELKFLGKNYARLLASLDTTTVIKPDLVHNEKPENMTSENLYITGDNLDALKHLLNSYAGKIKCIYIDPPYNTGSDGFVYNDSFNFTVDDLMTKLSISEAQAQRILDLTRRGSASHSAWLMFMYPRLQLARDLLSNDGVIFISIDDNEQANLKLICDDIFGEESFVSTLVRKGTGARQDSSYFAIQHEYVLCLLRDSSRFVSGKIIKENSDLDYPFYDELKNKRYKTQLLRKWGANSRRIDRPNLFYAIKDPDGNPNFPMLSENEEGCWRWGKETMQKNINAGNIEFKKNNDIWVAYEKIYQPDEGETNTKLYSSYLDGILSSTGTSHVKKLLGEIYFDFPKPYDLITKLLKMGGVQNYDIVLDFFSGSATTADAVMQLNAEDGGKRKFIMVQLPEIIEEDKPAYKAGYRSIDEIGRERILRAAQKIKEENPETTADLGFKHFILQEPGGKQLKEIISFNPEDNKLFDLTDLAKEFGTDTVLTTWLVRDGYGFSPQVNRIRFGEYTGYHVDKHLYLIDQGLVPAAIEAIVTKYDSDPSFNPENLVLFGYSFTWTEMESLQTNLKRLKATEKNLRINFDIRY